jgi:hypothetical protein
MENVLNARYICSHITLKSGSLRIFHTANILLRCSLSLMSTIKKLLEGKGSGFGLETREYGRKDRSR